MSLLISAIRRLQPSAIWVLAVSTVHLLAYSFQLGPALQVPTSMLFFLTCPGALINDWLITSLWPSRIALTLGASLATNILIATLLLATSTYSAERGTIIIALLSFVLALLTAGFSPSRLEPDNPAIGYLQ